MPSFDKVHFPSSNTNSTTDEIYFPVDNTHLRFSFPDVFPSTAMLKQSNTARTEPLKYISTIEKYKMNIKTKNEHSYLYINEKIKINLYKGITAFDDCIKF